MDEESLMETSPVEAALNLEEWAERYREAARADGYAAFALQFCLNEPTTEALARYVDEHAEVITWHAGAIARMTEDDGEAARRFLAWNTYFGPKPDAPWTVFADTGYAGVYVGVADPCDIYYETIYGLCGLLFSIQVAPRTPGPTDPALVERLESWITDDFESEGYDPPELSVELEDGGRIHIRLQIVG
ncbi:MAG: hypothetical protein EP329_18705 [Deltaproteobacteria bacterium]|nr:MAG: hypothetical protein EP329_18705 [Deltaproteobacteria bacterium]